ncbi:MAG: VOC family protein [Alphaproteobacteria bacterium]|nr:VOC family protein [Alphaproteobacteria bacterium]
MARSQLPDYIANSPGSPVYAATIGVDDLDRSVDFYQRFIGLDVVAREPLSGPAFEAHWQLPRGTTGEMAVLADRCAVGRVALIRWSAADRVPVRDVAQGQRSFGLMNLNFYTQDIEGHTRQLAAAGYRPWSPPVVHDMGEHIGEPIEVMIDGPDTVILNLIQLQARSPKGRIRETLAYTRDAHGFNRCGLTPVVTMQHCVRDADRALGFYQRVLKMGIRVDTILHGAEMERFMGYPPGAKTRDTYVHGNHMFGKIAVNQPLNFPCTDMVGRAVPPNVGLIAQSFIVPDLAAALAECANVSAAIYSPAVECELPALGRVRSAIVRNPGSGALQELVERD